MWTTVHTSTSINFHPQSSIIKHFIQHNLFSSISISSNAIHFHKMSTIFLHFIQCHPFSWLFIHFIHHSVRHHVGHLIGHFFNLHVHQPHYHIISISIYHQSPKSPVKSLAGIITHQGHISKVSSTCPVTHWLSLYLSLSHYLIFFVSQTTSRPSAHLVKPHYKTGSQHFKHIKSLTTFLKSFLKSF